MSTVLITGNGFDLNLGLPTGYKDFLSSQFFPVGTHLGQYLMEIERLQQWVDVEVELVRYSNRGSKQEEFLWEYKALKGGLMQYLASLDSSSLEKHSNAFRVFAHIANQGDFNVINFNYTDTVENIIRELFQSRRHPKIDVAYPHGSIARREIIFGVDDSATISESHSFLYKSTSSIFGGALVRRSLLGSKRVHIFGHSLGVADHMYFKEWFLNLLNSTENCALYLYHYGELGKYAIYRQLQTLTHQSVAKIKSLHHVFDLDISSPLSGNWDPFLPDVSSYSPRRIKRV